MRVIDADAFDERVRVAGGMSEEELTEDFKDGVQTVLYMLSKQPTIQFEPHWISCSERLPENEHKTYWVCTDIGYQCECRWTNVNPIWTALTTDWHWNIFDTPQYTKVVAWMTLPEPYEEK